MEQLKEGYAKIKHDDALQRQFIMIEFIQGKNTHNPILTDFLRELGLDDNSLNEMLRAVLGEPETKGMNLEELTEKTQLSVTELQVVGKEIQQDIIQQRNQGTKKTPKWLRELLDEKNDFVLPRGRSKNKTKKGNGVRKRTPAPSSRK